MTSFIDNLKQSWRRRNSLLCIGLDPDYDRLPRTMRTARAPLFTFAREVVDATAEHACAFKPQIAHYAARGAERELEQTIAHIKQHHPDTPVILDAKRGDIGATAEHYAREAFVRYDADAVTVNPYLGFDALAPFLAHRERGVFVLCRTSNPGGDAIQNRAFGNTTLAHYIADCAMRDWNQHGNIGLVVGATHPREVGAIRRLAGQAPLLVPGVGAQGGDLAAVVQNGITADRDGLLINVSRAILYAEPSGDFAAVAAAAAAFCAQINALRDG